MFVDLGQCVPPSKKHLSEASTSRRRDTGLNCPMPRTPPHDPGRSEPSVRLASSCSPISAARTPLDESSDAVSRVASASPIALLGELDQSSLELQRTLLQQAQLLTDGSVHTLRQALMGFAATFQSMSVAMSPTVDHTVAYVVYSAIEVIIARHARSTEVVSIIIEMHTIFTLVASVQRRFAAWHGTPAAITSGEVHRAVLRPLLVDARRPNLVAAFLVEVAWCSALNCEPGAVHATVGALKEWCRPYGCSWEVAIAAARDLLGPVEWGVADCGACLIEGIPNVLGILSRTSRRAHTLCTADTPRSDSVLSPSPTLDWLRGTPLLDTAVGRSPPP